MSNYSHFSKMLNTYINKNGFHTNIESDTATTSCNRNTGTNLCKIAIPAIDMDSFAKKIYRKRVWPESITENDSPNSADAFFISHDNRWFLIEYKDQEIKNAKDSVTKKAYSNAYLLLDVLFEMQNDKSAYPWFDYNSPLTFMRTNVEYILVFSSIKNPQKVIQYRNHACLGQNYVPDFMQKLSYYIFRQAYALPEYGFENEFLKKFVF